MGGSGPDAMCVVISTEPCDEKSSPLCDVISSEPCDERSFLSEERFLSSFEMTYRLVEMTWVLSSRQSEATRDLMNQQRQYYVYILTNWNNRVLYIGVTSDLTRRIYEHKNKVAKGFTEKYNVDKLIYFQETNDALTAITREKEIKKWRRQKKNDLVSSMNPDWTDLSDTWRRLSSRVSEATVVTSIELSSDGCHFE
jgi:putative endonuclease